MKKVVSRPQPTDLRLRRTRRALREGLLTLIRARPLDDITVRDIASQSLVGYNTFFRHYATKTELIEEIVLEEIQQLFERALPAIGGADTRKASLAICEYVDEHRELWSALLGEGAAPALRRMFISRALSGNVRLPEHQWLPMELGAIFGVGATLDILGWWVTKSDGYTASQAAELLDRLVLAPALKTS